MSSIITDSASIEKVINLLFGRLPVYLYDSEGETPIKIISLKEKGLVVFNSKKVNDPYRMLGLTHNGTKFLIQFKYLGGDDKGIEVLKPLKMSVAQAKREMDRIVLNDKNISLIVTNIINQNDISKAIGFEDKLVDKIVKEYSQRLFKKFKNVNICISARMDGRMRLMHNYDQSIFVQNRFMDVHDHPGFLPFAEYERLLAVTKLSDSYISEISIPIKYKGYSPLGYIQVNSDSNLGLDSYEVISKISASLTSDIISTGVFQESKEICEVNDLSSTGLSFLHPQSRIFSRSLTMGETIVFDLKLPGDVKIVCRGIIKNIKNTEVMFRVGVQFYNNSAVCNEKLDSFLQSSSDASLS
jgi:hypothetical protein